MKTQTVQTVESNESVNTNQSEEQDRQLLRQATLGQAGRNQQALEDLDNKTKHRFVIADFAQEEFPADLLLDSITNFDSMNEKTVEEYANNIDSDSPKFWDTAEVLAKIQSFDITDYQEYFEEHKNQTSSSSSNKTNKERLSELTDQVQRLASALESHRNLLNEISEKV